MGITGAVLVYALTSRAPAGHGEPSARTAGDWRCRRDDRRITPRALQTIRLAIDPPCAGPTEVGAPLRRWRLSAAVHGLRASRSSPAAESGVAQAHGPRADSKPVRGQPADPDRSGGRSRSSILRAGDDRLVSALPRSATAILFNCRRSSVASWSVWLGVGAAGAGCSGLYLCAPMQPGAGSSGRRAFHRGARTAKAVRSIASWHGAVGIWSLLLFMRVNFTGV